MSRPTVETLPKFQDLPLDPSHPPHSAWIWGPDDALGCLNHLTPERVATAAGLITAGISVGLNWGLHQMSTPAPYRKKLDHKIFALSEHINDDEIHINTQTSTQWDGFRHWCYPDGRFYNGVTQHEIRTTSSGRNGIHHWTRKGIAGRGVLIDYYSHMQETGTPYEPWSGTQIPVSTVKAIAEKCGIEFRAGDILFLRTGFVPAYEGKSESELEQLMRTSKEMHYPGLAQKEESLEWLWETHFAAVAADNPGFEAWDGGIGESKEGHMRLHEALLSGFGLPIGELFDLEALAEECKRQKRWEFFVTSMPLNLYGGVGSPPNAMTIF